MCVLIPKKKEKKRYMCDASIYRLESQSLPPHLTRICICRVTIMLKVSRDPL